jgi:RNA 2',3'-cyclic 3'-phosphodiesterase
MESPPQCCKPAGRQPSLRSYGATGRRSQGLQSSLEFRRCAQQIGGTMISDSPAGHLRLFVAIALPETVRDEILRAQRELQSLVPREAVRWTRPDQFHLTLRFLGDVAADDVEALKLAAGAVCRNASPLSLRAQGVGFFPNSRSPRVTWVGINDRENRLIELQKGIEAAVGPFSPEPGEKNFSGHVTLGRLKKPGPSEIRALAARAQSFETQTFGNWTAHDVEIIRSELSSLGARYTSLAVFRLGAEKI